MLQGEYEAAKAESEAAEAELKAHKSKRPAHLAAFLKAREVQASFIIVFQDASIRFPLIDSSGTFTDLWQ